MVTIWLNTGTSSICKGYKYSTNLAQQLADIIDAVATIQVQYLSPVDEVDSRDAAVEKEIWDVELVPALAYKFLVTSNE
jgi:hypothetical protein